MIMGTKREIKRSSVYALCNTHCELRAVDKDDVSRLIVRLVTTGERVSIGKGELL